MTRVEKVSGSGNAFYLRVTERVQGYLQTFLDSREEVAGLTGPPGASAVYWVKDRGRLR